MQITNKEVIKQALANNRLEERYCSQEVLDLLEKASSDPKITTGYILDVIRKS